ncbi:MAG: hypothetical protein JWO30_1627 [Fibrobacteres bacterium]|nr:hypothetical protein [Fibrobacterota bacterium]
MGLALNIPFSFFDDAFPPTYFGHFSYIKLAFGRPVLETSEKGFNVKSNNFVHIAFVLGLTMLAMDASYGQAPPTTLRLTSKVRDFRELPDAKLPSSVANYHPDFNTFNSCDQTGYVDAVIQTTGALDTANFPNDNRNPKLINARAGCFTSFARFDEWYNDKDTETNRPFLYDLVFQRTPAGMYEYQNSNFFPMDNDSLTRTDPVTNQKITKNLKGQNLVSFGHLNTGANAAHNFGFTMEFHANFTYIASADPAKQQIFTFTGDDDVWVFINGKLAIDLGGVHAALSKTITLNAAQEANLGLENGKSYLLDFFIAERHITQSNCRITTSLVLETQKVATPVATPGTSSFNSQLAVTLSSATPDVKIYYTTNGNAPDSNSTLYTGPIPITTSTTVKAIAYKIGWTKSDVMTAVYTKNFVASTLDILDQNGNPLSGGYITELNSAYTVKVTTTQAGLASITPGATTQVAADQETLTLTNPLAQGDNFLYSGTSPFQITTATLNNSKTEATAYDFLTVKWVNPLDSRDTASKTVVVRPAPRQARAYFSSNVNGTDTLDQYTGTETKIFLIVLDQMLPSGVTPTVTLETTPKVTSRGKDTETFNLTAISAGKYSVAVNVDLVGAASVVGDKSLQLALGDQILGSYKDPVDGDVASANAGFGIAPNLDASLQFTDKNGNVLPNGFYYSPAEGFLYLTYKDDWVNGSIPKKTVMLVIGNNGGKAGADSEVTFTLDLTSHAGSTGEWKGSFPLKDLPTITKLNGTAETYILGEVHASAPAHNNVGVASLSATDDLLVAFGNQDPVIGIEGPGGPGVQINRDDPGVKITIKDQSISSARDTLYATLSCTENKDVVVNVMLIEKADKPGEYESVILSKSEGASVVDGVLQCQPKDFIKVTYKDPVYGDVKEVQVLIDNPVTSKLYFSSKADGSDEITAVNDLDADFFYVVILARSPDVAKVDNLQVTFTTPQGETETFTAVETGVYSQKFIAKVPFGFVTTSPVAGNSMLEGKITAKEVNNYVTAIGTATVDNATVKAPIDLVAGFAPVEKAYIKDSNGDGMGDKVYIVFEKKLSRLPTTLSAQWNDSTSATKIAPKLSFLNADSTVVVADYSGGPFPAGLTAAGPVGNPRALLPNDALFKGQKPIIEDSIGPIILSAIKHPSNLNSLVANDPNYNLDTLIVTLSEPLEPANFKTMLKFSTSCDDYANAKTIEAVNTPNPTPGKPTEYIVIVNNAISTPLAGNCLFLNADPGPNQYVDMHKNPPPEYGVVLLGFNRDQVIQGFRGFPPVAGLDPNNPNFQVAVQDSRDSTKGGYATNRDPSKPWEVLWIPPYGFTEAGGLDPYKATLNDLPGGTKETATPVRLPPGVSAVQVVSTTAYIAHIAIFDNYGNFVRSSIQVFGGRGELQNQARTVPKGLVSFLYWDMKDKNGQLAGQGVYVWKVSFEFKGGKQEIRYTRTGVMR